MFACCVYYLIVQEWYESSRKCIVLNLPRSTCFKADKHFKNSFETFQSVVFFFFFGYFIVSIQYFVKTRAFFSTSILLNLLLIQTHHHKCFVRMNIITMVPHHTLQNIFKFPCYGYWLSTMEQCTVMIKMCCKAT